MHRVECCTPSVGADSIRPKADGIEPFAEWKQRPVTVLGFPRGEAGMANNRHFGTDYLP